MGMGCFTPSTTPTLVAMEASFCWGLHWMLTASVWGELATAGTLIDLLIVNSSPETSPGLNTTVLLVCRLWSGDPPRVSLCRSTVIPVFCTNVFFYPKPKRKANLFILYSFFLFWLIMEAHLTARLHVGVTEFFPSKGKFQMSTLIFPQVTN